MKVLEAPNDSKFVDGLESIALFTQGLGSNTVLNTVFLPNVKKIIGDERLNTIKERANQIDLKQNYEFATFKPPIITFIPGPMSHISSSLIRKIRKRGNA